MLITEERLIIVMYWCGGIVMNTGMTSVLFVIGG